jgi:hypothetical protein
MFREQLQDREGEIIRLLALIPREFVLIGGYAVSALSSHRFSVDCDVVISRKTSKQFRSLLRREGYLRRRSAKVGKETGGSVEIYVRTIKAGKISVDLFTNNITARETGASWSYEHIRRNSVEAVVTGIRNSANVTVPTRELLIAMKIHSGRDADVRDIVMLCENADWNYVAKHIARGDIKILLNQLTKIIDKLEGEEFISSLRATFELRQNIKPLISTCKRGLSNLKEVVEGTRL